MLRQPYVALAGQCAKVRALAWRGDRRLVVGGANNEGRGCFDFWYLDNEERRPSCTNPWPENVEPIRREIVAIASLTAPLGLMAFGTAVGEIFLWIPGEKEATRIPRSVPRQVDSLSFSVGGKWLAIAGEAREIWNIGVTDIYVQDSLGMREFCQFSLEAPDLCACFGGPVLTWHWMGNNRQYPLDLHDRVGCGIYPAALVFVDRDRVLALTGTPHGYLALVVNPEGDVVEVADSLFQPQHITSITPATTQGVLAYAGYDLAEDGGLPGVAGANLVTLIDTREWRCLCSIGMDRDARYLLSWSPDGEILAVAGQGFDHVRLYALKDIARWNTGDFS